VLAEQEPGDEEPRQDEEDVDSHEAAVETGQPGVVEQDEQDRDAPEAFEIGAELTARRADLALVFHGPPSSPSPSRRAATIRPAAVWTPTSLPTSRSRRGARCDSPWGSRTRIRNVRILECADAVSPRPDHSSILSSPGWLS
jgi:hypothetical protein